MSKAPEAAWPASKIEMWPLAKIKPYDRNPRTHPEEQVDLIAKSMLTDGVTAPILVDEAGVILYGHGRRLAALKNGFARYPVLVARGWTDEQKIKVRISDNQLGLLSGWDNRLMVGELQALADAGFDLPLLGFDGTRLQEWGFDVRDADMPPLPNGDRAPFQQMTFTLHDDQVEVVKAALELAKVGGFDGPNENSNGNALARIAEAYREADQDRADNGRGRQRAGQKGALQRQGVRKQPASPRRLPG